MKLIGWSICLVAFMALSVAAQPSKDDYKLPELHTIKTVTLSPSYSCRSQAEFSRGYAGTALFLSDYGKQHNSPDLLFNGACKADDYFEAATAGDAFSLIADLGSEVSLADVSASRAFNLKRVHTDGDYSKFAQTVKVVPRHTYAVLLNERTKRGLFVFTVDEYVPNQKVLLRYAVKSYELMADAGDQRSPGFDWDKGNH